MSKMVYDPVTCMMVQEGKTRSSKDASARAQGYINSINSEKDIEIAEKLVKRAGYDNGVSDFEYEEIRNVFRKKFGRNVRDHKAIDRAIKTLDDVRVDVSEWQFANGRKQPSGYGMWWFKIGNEEKRFSGNYSEVKSMAIKYAKEKGIFSIQLMS